MYLAILKATYMSSHQVNLALMEIKQKALNPSSSILHAAGAESHLHLIKVIISEFAPCHHTLSISGQWTVNKFICWLWAVHFLN